MLNKELKIHMMFAMIAVGTLFYMYLMYKNIKLFESEIDILKEQVNALLPQDIKNMQEKVKTILKSKQGSEKEIVFEDVESKFEIKVGNDVDEEFDLVEVGDVDADDVDTIDTVDEVDDVDGGDGGDGVDGGDDDSVCTNEIKSIIDTIQNDVVVEKKHPFDNLTLTELSSQKYEDLKAFLKESGLSVKGTKAELAKRIIDIIEK